MATYYCGACGKKCTANQYKVDMAAPAELLSDCHGAFVFRGQPLDLREYHTTRLQEHDEDLYLD